MKLACRIWGHKTSGSPKFEYTYDHDNLRIDLYSLTCTRCGNMEFYIDMSYTIQTKGEYPLGTVHVKGSIKDFKNLGVDHKKKTNEFRIRFQDPNQVC